MTHWSATALNDGVLASMHVTATVPTPRNLSYFNPRRLSLSMSLMMSAIFRSELVGDGVERWRTGFDARDRHGADTEEFVVLQPAPVELVDVLDDVRHLGDGIIASLGRGSVAGSAFDNHLDLHATAMSAIDTKMRRLGDDHVVRHHLLFFNHVQQAQTVAILFHHAAAHPQRIAAAEHELLDRPPRIH